MAEGLGLSDQVILGIIGAFTTVILAVMGIAGPVIIKKLDVIHELANSNLAKANDRLDALYAQIKVLQDAALVKDVELTAEKASKT